MCSPEDMPRFRCAELLHGPQFLLTPSKFSCVPQLFSIIIAHATICRPVDDLNQYRIRERNHDVILHNIDIAAARTDAGADRRRWPVGLTVATLLAQRGLPRP